MAPTQYAKGKPQWNGTPLFNTEDGYDQWLRNRKGRAGVYAQSNGNLNNNTYTWPLFITDVQINYAVQGSIGQSRTTRDFYPQNFVQPAFTIVGQSLDNADYGTLCEYVRYCQTDLVNNFSTSNLMQFQLFQRGFPGNRRSGPTVTVTDTKGHTQTFWNQIIRGAHKPIIAQGVVLSMPRQHETGVFAPTWTMGFQCYAMLQGPYVEGPPLTGGGATSSWLSLITSKGSQQFMNTNSLTKANKTDMSAVLKDSANIFNTTASHNATSSTTTATSTAKKTADDDAHAQAKSE